MRSDRRRTFLANPCAIARCVSMQVETLEPRFVLTGPYAATGLLATDTSILAWATGATALQRGPQNITAPATLASAGTADSAIGSVDNNPITLGDGGSIVVSFAVPICDGPGSDFAVFENGFSAGGPGLVFAELAFVEVSSNGVDFFRFPAVSLTQTTTQIGGFGTLDATLIHNLAGQFAAPQGTPFDLSDLAGVSPLLDLQSITHVRVIDVVGNIDPAYACYDSRGVPINDPWATPFPTGGFDLDAVGVLHQQTPPTIARLENVIGPTTGGTLVTLVGSNFIGITSVTFAGIPAATFSVVSATEVTALAPAHSVGAVDVVVVNGAGSTSLAGVSDFTYAKPAVTSVVVNGGSAVIQGSTVILSGQHSVVKQILVTFNQPVTVAADAFAVTPRTANVHLSGGAAPSANAATTSVTQISSAEYIVTFIDDAADATPSTHSGGILNSGIYDLTVLASKISANSETMAGNQVTPFFALFGSIDANNSYTSGPLGNGASHVFVDPGSLFQFSDTFGSSVGGSMGPVYNFAFDANLDGSIDPGDLFAFSDAFGTDWTF